MKSNEQTNGEFIGGEVATGTRVRRRRRGVPSTLSGGVGTEEEEDGMEGSLVSECLLFHNGELL